jgi:UDP-N-acetylmuramate--alanine ligase
MNLNSIRNVYFLGIGGIGMSAIARYFHALGCRVEGYDKTPSPLTYALQNEGIRLHFDETIGAMPAFVQEDPQATLLVYTPAIPSTHPQREWLENSPHRLYKRSEVLGLISRDSYTIAVAGTHGKTTTSTLIAHILQRCGVNYTAFLGGISTNYQTNYLHYTAGRNPKSKPIVVLEADEFDRSFHRLTPDIAVITAIDPDHLDIYETEAAFREAFTIFADRTRPQGHLYLHDSLKQGVHSGVPTSTYGLAEPAPANTAADFSGENLRIENGYFKFDLSMRGASDRTVFTCGLPGRHNAENSVVAAAVCIDGLGLDAAAVVQGIETFRGVKRRFEYLVRTEQHVVIDDYAHHPTELQAIISSVRMLYPGQEVWGVFQPHLFTRTRDFAAGFAESLALLDRLLLMEIYPAREQPLPGINGGWLLEQVPMQRKELADGAGILGILKTEKPRVLLVLGAGDIDRLCAPIQKLYQDG